MLPIRGFRLVLKTYHVLGFHNSDDLLEYIDKPLGIQNYKFTRRCVVISLSSEVDDPAKVVIKSQHCWKIISNAKCRSEFPDLEGDWKRKKEIQWFRTSNTWLNYNLEMCNFGYSALNLF